MAAEDAEIRRKMENEKRDEIKQLVRDILTEQRGERMLANAAYQEKLKDSKEERLFLIGFGGYMYIPDAKGRAIGTQTVYARVKVDKEKPDFYGGPVTLVAFGDGRILGTPFTALLTGHSAISMVEVPESILACMKPE